MIDFRYHLVSIIAIFFALAAGIALGAGPLNDQADQLVADQVSELSKNNKELRDQIGAAQSNLQYADTFATGVSPALLPGRLSGQTVALVALPGADPELVEALGNAVEAGGGGLTGTVVIENVWTDAASAATLDSLGAALVSQGTTLPDGDGYQRGAVVLASVLAKQGTAVEQDRIDSVLTAYSSAGLLSGKVSGAADLVIAIAGTPFTGDEAERRTSSMVALVKALDVAGSGSVAAEATHVGGEASIVDVIREDREAVKIVSTVDVAELPSGQITTVLALQEQQQGRAGQYGSEGSENGAVPESVIGAAVGP